MATRRLPFLTLGEKLDLNGFATDVNWMQIKGLKFDLIRRKFEGVRYCSLICAKRRRKFDIFFTFAFF